MISFRNYWGTRKREELLESLVIEDFNNQYQTVRPTKENRFCFHPL